MNKQSKRQSILTAILFIIFVLLIVVAGNAQKLTVKQYNQLELVNQKKIVTQSLKYNDANTAIQAMHAIIAIEGENSSYKDSLAVVYYSSGKMLSAALLSKELLTKKPSDLQLMEIRANSLQGIGDAKEAVNVLENLAYTSKKRSHAYQLAYLQFGMKRLSEAQKTVEFALTLNDMKDAYIPYPSIKDKNVTQKIPLKSALLNLQGLIAYDLKDNKAAEKAFKEALEIAPDFEYAQQSLLSLEALNKSEIKKE